MNTNINLSNKYKNTSLIALESAHTFYDALYKSIPNQYIIKQCMVFTHIESFFDTFYDFIKDYYIEKYLCTNSGNMIIKNIAIVLDKDILLHSNLNSNECTIMYKQSDKKLVQCILNFILQYKNQA